MSAMIADETPPRNDDAPPRLVLEVANDDTGATAIEVDPRVLAVARAIGRQIALEDLKALRAANDNKQDETP